MPLKVAGVKSLKELVSVSNQADFHTLMMVYGDPNAGKTHLLGSSLEAGKRVLVLDCDLGGIETLWKVEAPYATIHSWEQFKQVLADLRAGAWKDYDVIGIDTMSSLQETLVADLLTGGHKDDWSVFRTAKNELVGQLRELKKYPLLIVATAHVREEFVAVRGSEQKRLHKATPDLYPAIWKGLNKITGITCRLTTRTGEGDTLDRFLKLDTNAVFAGKDRYGLMPASMKDPTMGKIFNTLETRNAQDSLRQRGAEQLHTPGREVPAETGGAPGREVESAEGDSW